MNWPATAPGSRSANNDDTFDYALQPATHQTISDSGDDVAMRAVSQRRDVINGQRISQLLPKSTTPPPKQTRAGDTIANTYGSSS